MANDFMGRRGFPVPELEVPQRFSSALKTSMPSVAPSPELTYNQPFTPQQISASGAVRGTMGMIPIEQPPRQAPTPNQAQPAAPQAPQPMGFRGTGMSLSEFIKGGTSAQLPNAPQPMMEPEGFTAHALAAGTRPGPDGSFAPGTGLSIRPGVDVPTMAQQRQDATIAAQKAETQPQDSRTPEEIERDRLMNEKIKADILRATQPEATEYDKFNASVARMLEVGDIDEEEAKKHRKAWLARKSGIDPLMMGEQTGSEIAGASGAGQPAENTDSGLPDNMPSPAEFSGKTIKAPSGDRYKSDGNKWTKV